MLRETEVKNGRLRGLPGNDPRITVYKGIPYAAPPIGDLRWCAPQPSNDWTGTYDAYRFAPALVDHLPHLSQCGLILPVLPEERENMISAVSFQQFFDCILHWLLLIRMSP